MLKEALHDAAKVATAPSGVRAAWRLGGRGNGEYLDASMGRFAVFLMAGSNTIQPTADRQGRQNR